jgi:signal transduction histidine kinase
MSRLSPYHILISSAVLIVLVLITCMGLALSIPCTTPRIQQSADTLVIAPSSTHAALPIVAFNTPSGQIPALPVLMVEEPDVLPSYAAFNQLMQQHRQLAQASQHDALWALTAQGPQRVFTHARQGSDLPFLFWFQLLVGAAGALTGAAIYAFSINNAATRYYALTGLGYLLFAPSAAIYSTRGFFLQGDVFRVLSAINHFGALFFTASLLSLLWHYPAPLKRWPVPALAYGCAGLFWALDLMQQLPDMSWAALSVLVLFVCCIAIAMAQGWRARRRPVDRASFRWFILSIFLGTGLFAAFVMVPIALKMPPIASQGLMFGAFLLMYWGLALGLLRYRLFELETWWFSIWSWFLSGLSIVVLDILLVSLISVSGQTALTISVAVVGWLYFPMRQWVLQRVRRDARQDIDQWLPVVLPLLLDVRLGSDQERQILKRWPHILSAVFDPLHLTRQAHSGNATIVTSGQLLLIPDLVLTPTDATPLMFALHHAARGQRLFTRQDLHTVQMLTQLADLALSVARARDTGARLERERIARDIHDDLGARLLYLLQKSGPEQQVIVRETLDDLRYLLNSLDGEDITLDEAMADWRAETSKRAQGSTARLSWQVHLADDRTLTAFEYHHLTRMLREAITNIFKHSQPSHIRIEVYHPSPDTLTIAVHNDGPQIQTDVSGGRGLQNMQRRAQSLNGSIHWQRDQDYHIEIRVSLSDYDAHSLIATPLESSS